MPVTNKVSYPNLGYTPPRMPVTTRIIIFLVGDQGIPINLYLPLASWGGRSTPYPKIPISTFHCEMGKTQYTSVLVTLTLKALCSCCSFFATWIQPNNLNMGNTAFSKCFFSCKKRKNFHSSLTLMTLWLTALSHLNLWVTCGPWFPDYPGKVGSMLYSDVILLLKQMNSEISWIPCRLKTWLHVHLGENIYQTLISSSIYSGQGIYL